MPEYGCCAEYGGGNRVKVYQKSIHIIQVLAKGKPDPKQGTGSQNNVKKV